MHYARLIAASLLAAAFSASTVWFRLSRKNQGRSFGDD